MTPSFHPDMYWVRRALLMAILTHPYVSGSRVSYPSIGGAAIPDVTIQRGRLFGGPELIEPGLTLAVYPYHSSFDPIDSVPPNSLNSELSVIYSGRDKLSRYSTMGGVEGRKSQGMHAEMKFMVQLFYRDAVYDAPISIGADYTDPENNYTNDYYGYNFQYADDTPPNLPRLQDVKTEYVQSKEITVQILPAEEILTQWLDIVKYAIRDIAVLRPFPSIRNPVILCADYPTSSWKSQSANLIFHTAYLVVQFDSVEPVAPNFVQAPNIQSLNLDIE